MARFYVNVQGNRGEATRMGTPKSGIHSHTRGWNVGIKVDGYVGPDGEDEFDVWLTSGSTGAKSSKLIKTFTRKDLES